MHLALGPLVYWQDNARHHVPKCFGAPFPRSESSEAMAFDGVIVILSVVDILNDLASGAGERMCSLSAHKNTHSVSDLGSSFRKIDHAEVSSVDTCYCPSAELVQSSQIDG